MIIMRASSVMLLGILALSLSCKPRSAGNLTRSLSTEGGQGYQPDPVAAKEAAIVRGTCDGKATSLFRGTGEGDRVDYASAGSSAIAEGAPITQIPWYEEARFFEGKWQLSAAIVGRKDIPECLRTATELTTKQLTIALGCDTGEACAVNPPPCQGDACNLTTVQTVSGDSPAPDTGTGMALNDDGAVSCQAVSGGFQLKNGSGKPIGKAVESEIGCKHLTGTYSGGLVCAWTGNGLLPARVADGGLIGNASAAASNSLSACASMIATADSGVVCSWNGSGFAPYRIVGEIRSIGGEGAAPDLALCAEKTVVRGNRTCSWDGRDVRIFDLATLKATPGVAAFDTYEACHRVLKRVATPAGMQQYLVDLKAVDAPTQSDAGLNLAGDAGWTWEACKDRTREYHLVERSGGSLVCQGKIDQLYSWGPQVKIDYLKNQSWSGQLMRDGKAAPIFTSQSGYSTYGYGPRSIRFRLKPGVRFQFFDNTAAYSVCQQVADVDTTVAVRYWDIGQLTGTDYILCSLGPVHSWSISTSTHFSELQREKAWIERFQGQTNGYFNYEMYVKVDGVDNMPAKLDGFDFAPSIWQSRKSLHQQYLPGEVFFNPSLPAAEKQTAQHYRTEWPTYINPGEGGGGGGGQPQPDLIGGGAAGGGALKYSDFIPSKFKSASGRTLWLNAGKACSAKKGGSTAQCTWTFTAPNQIEAKFNDTTWYYKAKDASNICFTGEGSPGANCASGGEMTKYN